MVQIQRNNPMHAYLVIKSVKRMLILIYINLIKVSVPDQENEPSFICVLWISILPLFPRFSDLIFDLF